MQVGDVLVQGEKGAQILVVPELVDHLEFSLTQACTSLLPLWHPFCPQMRSGEAETASPPSGPVCEQCWLFLARAYDSMMAALHRVGKPFCMSVCMLVQVRSVSVVTRAVPLTDLVVRAPKVQEVRQPSASRHPAPRSLLSARQGEQLHCEPHAANACTVCVTSSPALASLVDVPVKPHSQAGTQGVLFYITLPQ